MSEIDDDMGEMGKEEKDNDEVDALPVVDNMQPLSPRY